MFSRQQALIAGFVLLLGLSAAACATAPPQSTAMKLGALTAAPDAFVDFCRRQPLECGVSKGEAESAAALVQARQAEAMRLGWLAAFGEVGSLPAVKSAFATSAVEQAPDWNTLFGAAEGSSTLAASDWDTPTAAAGAVPRVDWAAAFARAPASTPMQSVDHGALRQAQAIDLAQAPVLDASLWGKLNRVNSRINRAIVRSTDTAAYGVEDLWSLPLESGQKYGDCEDYVLEKRLALIADGVPPNALSIAVVETSWGEGHAVLVVTTDNGEYVLDNQTPWILPWTQTSYRWLARQTANGPLSWALVATS